MQKVQEYEKPKVVTYGERKDELDPACITCTTFECATPVHGDCWSVYQNNNS